MTLWLILFLLIIAISFFLALLSMKDYQEIPVKSPVEHSLFLVRRPKGLNENALDLIYENLVNGGLIFSVERLFKGKESALVLFGPKEILNNFTADLDLLELEDYTKVLDRQNILAWEVSAKNPAKITLPQMGDDEQFWFQVVVGQNFQTQLRAVVYSKDPNKRGKFPQILEELSSEGLIKMPVPFGSAQILEFYRSRTLTQVAKGGKLDSKTLAQMITV